MDDPHYFISNLQLTEEMFFTHDISVLAKVSQDIEYNWHTVGYCHTELFRLEAGVYKHTGWKFESGQPVQNMYIKKALDRDLRAHLFNRWSVELYELMDIPLPAAHTKGSWWKRLVAWLKGMFK